MVGILFCFAGLLLLCQAGCTSVPPEPAPEAQSVSPQIQKIREADALMKEKKFRQAFMLYSEVRKEAGDVRQFRELQLKIAAAHFEMHNFPAALAAIAPMPELPATLHDCQKLVLAARILQKMKGKPEHIESLLEVALDNTIEEPGVIPFKAFGYAELGRVYVANQKTPRAIKCFQYAARLYEAAGDRENARICRNIMEYLR